MDGKELKNLREGQKISREKLARELDVSPTTVYRWENNIVAISTMNRLAIERVFENLKKK